MRRNGIGRQRLGKGGKCKPDAVCHGERRGRGASRWQGCTSIKRRKSGKVKYLVGETPACQTSNTLFAMPATNQRRPRLTNDRLALAGLLVFTLVVRGGVLWAMRANLQQDPDAYREIAENLLRHGEFALGKDEPTGDQPLRPTAYRPPLYPVVLSNLPAADGQRISLVKVAALHVLLGVAMVWLTWLTATRMLSRVGPASAARAGPLESGWDDVVQRGSRRRRDRPFQSLPADLFAVAGAGGNGNGVFARQERGIQNSEFRTE
jgi:hypothetical protein